MVHFEHKKALKTLVLRALTIIVNLTWSALVPSEHYHAEREGFEPSVQIDIRTTV